MTVSVPQAWPGTPYPLGATWDGEGTNFALYAPGASAVSVCLFDDAGREQRLALTELTYHIWHGYLPQVAPGARYGFRVWGPFDPARGQRWNPSKLLMDPYARAVDGEFALDDAVFGYPPGADDRTADHRDSAPFVPKAVVVHDAFPWGEDRRPATSWPDTVIYELHVRGFTRQHPAIPPELRGTYAGLAHPAAVEHLRRLGVTAVELMPVHHFVSEPAVLRRGLTNYWGYNSLAYFAPHAGYAAGGSRGEQVREFKAMVRALHAAGIEVILDVVYNHTAEGDHLGPTLSFRGIDNAGYYRLRDDDPRFYVNYTGTGNTLDARRAHVLGLIMDSLRYWVSEMHVDGFRFDLASALARSFHDVDKLSAFFDVIHQDPLISQVKLIAEPWDVGEGGYQVGEFPPLWTEWNGKYRDAVRSFWHPGGGTAAGELAFRLSGSSDLYQDDGRHPYASVNFITAHDGFTLADLVSYERKHNEANGEGNADGTDDNRSANYGVEGPTADPAVLARRARAVRNFLATLLLSTGVPMLRMGDELGHTQQGNNNAYVQDNELSWLPWSGGAAGAELIDYVAGLVHLRRAHPVLRRRGFFAGRPVNGGEVKDLAWFAADATEMGDDDWGRPARTLGMYLSGAGIVSRTPRGERITDDSLLLVLHAAGDPVTFRLPGPPWAARYRVLVDSAAAQPLPEAGAGGGYPAGAGVELVEPRVLLLLAEPPAQTET